MLLGGIECLALLGKDHVDVTAQFPKVGRQPFSGLGVRGDSAQHRRGALHDGRRWLEKPAGNQVGSQKDTATEKDTCHAEEPFKWLPHHSGGSHGRQKAEKPEREQDTESQGVHKV